MDKRGRIEYAQCAQKRRAKKRRAMINRGISFLPMKNGSPIKSKWSRIFATQIDAKTKKKIYYDQYRWHIFSCGMAPCLEEVEARKAFNQCLKKEVYAFYQNEDGAYLIKNPSLLRSEDFDKDYDIYIFDAIEKWTYINTHEGDFGPYFYIAK